MQNIFLVTSLFLLLGVDVIGMEGKVDTDSMVNAFSYEIPNPPKSRSQLHEYWINYLYRNISKIPSGADYNGANKLNLAYAGGETGWEIRMTEALEELKIDIRQSYIRSHDCREKTNRFLLTKKFVATDVEKNILDNSFFEQNFLDSYHAYEHLKSTFVEIKELRRIRDDSLTPEQKAEGFLTEKARRRLLFRRHWGDAHFAAMHEQLIPVLANIYRKNQNDIETRTKILKTWADYLVTNKVTKKFFEPLADLHEIAPKQWRRAGSRAENLDMLLAKWTLPRRERRDDSTKLYGLGNFLLQRCATLVKRIVELGRYDNYVYEPNDDEKLMLISLYTAVHRYHNPDWIIHGNLPRTWETEAGKYKKKLEGSWLIYCPNRHALFSKDDQTNEITVLPLAEFFAAINEVFGKNENRNGDKLTWRDAINVEGVGMAAVFQFFGLDIATATEAEVKEAYKANLLATHPDKNKDASLKTLEANRIRLEATLINYHLISDYFKKNKAEK